MADDAITILREMLVEARKDLSRVLEQQAKALRGLDVIDVAELRERFDTAVEDNRSLEALGVALRADLERLAAKVDALRDVAKTAAKAVEAGAIDELYLSVLRGQLARLDALGGPDDGPNDGEAPAA